MITIPSPLLNTTIQDSINPSQDVLVGGEDDSTLPPWLFSNAPKRKKQVVSPEDFDFSQIVPIKPKTTKKAKTFSRVKVDKNKNKYDKVVIPPQDVVIDQVQDIDYTIQRVELGKHTHDFAPGDAISTL